MSVLARIALASSVAAFALAVWAAPGSSATINVAPGAVAAASPFMVSGDVLAGGQPGCEVPGEVSLISPAFIGLAGDGSEAVLIPVDATGRFSGVITLPATVPPGQYQITGRCGGGNLGVTATITVVPPDALSPTSMTG